MTGFAVAYGILAIIMGIANIALYMAKHADYKIPNEPLSAMILVAGNSCKNQRGI